LTRRADGGGGGGGGDMKLLCGWIVARGCSQRLGVGQGHKNERGSEGEGAENLFQGDGRNNHQKRSQRKYYHGIENGKVINQSQLAIHLSETRRK
jgi:hypothetical protein